MFEMKQMKGVGKLTPEKGIFKNLGHGIIVPIGKTVKNDKVTRTEFDINRYMVFDKSQFIIRYLIKYSN